MRPSSRRSFDAARNDRYTSDWSSSPVAADIVIDRVHRALVARSRSEAQANDYVKKFLKLCKQNIVGPQGFAAQSQVRLADGTRDKPTNDALEAWWAEFSRKENCDVTGKRSMRELCNAITLSTAKDGEFFIRTVVGRSAGRFLYQLQILDPQRCPVDYNVERLPNGRFIRQGIEFNRVGRPIAYYFSTADLSVGSVEHHGSRLERIPATRIIHGFIEELGGERRGLPWTSTSLYRLHNLSGFEKAALTNARTSAAVGGFIEWEDGYGPDLDEADGQPRDEEFVIEGEGGVWQELPSGARVKDFNATYPAGEFATFRKAMLQGAGAGMGVSYVSLANDLEGVNFSSIRQGVLDEREMWMSMQEWLVDAALDRIRREALSFSLLAGEVSVQGRVLRSTDFDRVSPVFWQGRRWAWVDPKKDVEAEILSMNNGLSAPSSIIRRRGGDPESEWLSYGQDIKAMREAGIPDEFIAALMGQTAAPGSAPQPPDDGDDDGQD